jgi:cytoskeletal protein CcmA (bactofilin family)
MAVVYPTAAGDWSTRTWNDDATGAAYSGGTPQVGDTVLTNNLTITMDQNITIATISNRAGTNAAAGGTLDCPNGANGLTLTSQVRGNQTGATVTISMSSPNTLTINGNLTGGIDSGNQSNANAVRITSSALVTINGDVSGNSTNSREGLRVTGAADVLVTGDVRPAGNLCDGIFLDNTSATATIEGTVFGSTIVNNAAGLAVNRGLGLIRRARAGNPGAHPYTGNTRFIDINEPDLFSIRNSENQEVFLSLSVDADSVNIRGGFIN